MESLALLAVALAIVYHSWKGIGVADFSRITAALGVLAASLSEVAAAIRDPQVDNNDEAQVEAIASQIESAAQQLHDLAGEESALDHPNAGTVESATDPAEPTVDSDAGGEGTPDDSEPQG
jgi:erythromycin esterase-like protein